MEAITKSGSFLTKSCGMALKRAHLIQIAHSKKNAILSGWVVDDVANPETDNQKWIKKIYICNKAIL